MKTHSQHTRLIGGILLACLIALAGCGGGGGGGGGSTPLRPLATPAFTANFTDNTGGFGRLVGTNTTPFQIDGKDALMLVVGDGDIAALLADPAMTQLLDNATEFTFADTPTAMGTATAMHGGMVYVLGDDDRVYIHDDAPVALGYVRSFARGKTPQIVTIGEPLSNLPRGTASYSGLAVASLTSESITVTTLSDFTLAVNFDRRSASFNTGLTRADNMPGSAIAAPNLTINPSDGTFRGAVNIVPESGGGVNRAQEGTGALLGQFHGNGANGVSGVFDNGNDQGEPRLIGGFAGARQP